jgi:DNA-binding transcriptional MerR regulator
VTDPLAVIILCRRSGFTLAEIRTLLDRSGPTAWRTLAMAKVAELDSRIDDLKRARDGLLNALSCPHPDILRCEHFRATLDACLRRSGELH